MIYEQIALISFAGLMIFILALSWSPGLKYNSIIRLSSVILLPNNHAGSLLWLSGYGIIIGYGIIKLHLVTLLANVRLCCSVKVNDVISGGNRAVLKL